MFAQLGRWCYHHRWTVVIMWVALLFGGGTILNGAMGGPETSTEFTLPDVESKEGFDIFDEHFGGQGTGGTGSIVYLVDEDVEGGVTNPEVQGGMEELFTYIEELPTLSDEELDERELSDLKGVFQEGDIVSVSSPYEEGGENQISQRDEYAERLAYADIEVPDDVTFEEYQTVRTAVEDHLESGSELGEATVDGGLVTVDGVQIALGGDVFSEFEEPLAELVGIAFAILILIVAFGSVVAMGLPIGVGLAGIGVGTTIAGILSHVLEIPDFASLIGIMIGLGVGIDYALFIVTRYRENRRAGHNIEESTVIAVNTAGRAVAFAGATVVISLMGMLLIGLPFITGMAIYASVVVAATLAASLTLLPALTALVGQRIEITRWRGIIASGVVSVGLLAFVWTENPSVLLGALVAAVAIVGLGFIKGLPLHRALRERPPKPLEQTASYRWSRVIQHHPWAAALTGAALLMILAIPVFAIRFGFSDYGNEPEEKSTRQAYDLLAEGFGDGYNGPVLLASELPDGADPAVLESLTSTLEADEDVALVSPPLVAVDGEAAPAPELDEEALSSASAVMWRVIPTTSPQHEDTTSFVNRLRDDVLPEVTAGTGMDVAVTGNVAISVDFSDYLAERTPYFFGAVLGLSFLLLMVVFRSLLVPLKAVIMNLLGIGAAYGVLVAGFQWGWLGPVLGIEGGPIEPFMPMMLFAILFGLSMDYEVFLLSRVKEDYDQSGDAHTSVANGLAVTARVITAAALIMVTVFAAFALDPNRVAKMAGVGLAVAVLLDASVIRMLLVPATMELLGDRNWWIPGWLSRILPTIDVEGHGAEDEVAVHADGNGSDRQVPDRERHPVQ